MDTVLLTCYHGFKLTLESVPLALDQIFAVQILYGFGLFNEKNILYSDWCYSRNGYWIFRGIVDFQYIRLLLGYDRHSDVARSVGVIRNMGLLYGFWWNCW